MVRYITSIPRKPLTVRDGESVVIVGIITKGWRAQKTLFLDIGSHASADIALLIVGDGSAAFPFRCTSLQQGRDSHVRICMRSVLFDSASIANIATLTIDAEGNGSDAFFSHHILLLSDHASGTATPSLEIKTAFASAKHAASVSTFDEEGLWYLESRGCGAAQAMRMMIRGFLLSDSAMIDDKAALQRIEHKIDSILKSKKNYAS